MIQTFFLLFLLFILPVTLLHIGVIALRHRIKVLSAITILAVPLCVIRGFTLSDLGLQTSYSWASGVAYFLFTVVGLLLIGVLALLLRRRPQKDWYREAHFLFLFVPISFAQEFLFRGYGMAELQTVTHSVPYLILANSLLFTYMHTLYPPLKVSIPLGLLSGITFSWIYLLFPNLWLLGIVHAFLNFAAVLFGFFNNEYISS